MAQVWPWISVCGRQRDSRGDGELSWSACYLISLSLIPLIPLGSPLGGPREGKWCYPRQVDTRGDIIGRDDVDLLSGSRAAEAAAVVAGGYVGCRIINVTLSKSDFLLFVDLCGEDW